MLATALFSIFDRSGMEQSLGIRTSYLLQFNTVKLQKKGRPKIKKEKDRKDIRIQLCFSANYFSVITTPFSVNAQLHLLSTV